VPLPDSGSDFITLLALPALVIFVLRRYVLHRVAPRTGRGDHAWRRGRVVRLHDDGDDDPNDSEEESEEKISTDAETPNHSAAWEVPAYGSYRWS
jgi:hypothetical protein